MGAMYLTPLIKALLGLFLFRPCLGLFAFLGYSYRRSGLNPAGPKETAQKLGIKLGESLQD